MKRIISLLLALVIAISAAVPAYATGDGNFDGGGGSMRDTSVFTSAAVRSLRPWEPSTALSKQSWLAEDGRTG